MSWLVRSLVDPFTMTLANVFTLNRVPRGRRGRSSMGMGHSRGQGMLEYALIIALVAVVVIAALVLLGPQIAGIFNQVNNNL
jgi:pilus assembly protein Flp/PilA